MSDLASSVLDRLKNKKDDSNKTTDLQEIPLKPFKLTAAELRAVCDKNPTHPLATDKRKSVAGLPPTTEVVCDQPDIEAILDNKDVELHTHEVERDIMGEPTKVIVKEKRLVTRKTAVEAKPKQP